MLYILAIPVPQRLRSLSAVFANDKRALASSSTEDFDNILEISVHRVENEEVGDDSVESKATELPPVENLHAIRHEQQSSIDIHQIIEAEKKETGSNIIKSYSFYLQACGGTLFCILLVVSIIGMFLSG